MPLPPLDPRRIQFTPIHIDDTVNVAHFATIYYLIFLDTSGPDSPGAERMFVASGLFCDLFGAGCSRPWQSEKPLHMAPIHHMTLKPSER